MGVLRSTHLTERKCLPRTPGTSRKEAFLCWEASKEQAGRFPWQQGKNFGEVCDHSASLCLGTRAPVLVPEAGGKLKVKVRVATSRKLTKL